MALLLEANEGACARQATAAPMRAGKSLFRIGFPQSAPSPENHRARQAYGSLTAFSTGQAGEAKRSNPARSAEAGASPELSVLSETRGGDLSANQNGRKQPAEFSGAARVLYSLGSEVDLTPGGRRVGRAAHIRQSLEALLRLG